MKPTEIERLRALLAAREEAKRRWDALSTRDPTWDAAASAWIVADDDAKSALLNAAPDLLTAAEALRDLAPYLRGALPNYAQGEWTAEEAAAARRALAILEDR